MEWVNDTREGTEQVYLLLRRAGTGKSTIAHTIAGRLGGLGRRGSSFCCSTAFADRANCLFSTVAKDLADLNDDFKEALWKHVGHKSALLFNDGPAEQVKHLLLEPSCSMRLVTNVLILIVGLDEIGKPSVSKAFLDILSKQLKQLPPQVRVLLTARPEKDIYRAFDGAESVHIRELATVERTFKRSCGGSSSSLWGTSVMKNATGS
ncbi:hypothetical protein DACRYDRAFT_22133 [Dacryopinax primogenitus]|uniref:Nephrocystin 3-like N-terminal domain-containing protein n=1 Tax=Dacryopinax primogenitus (strain DJM 731) TaxID=1858805 RepID=M5FV90_DACPD|nr:uncharacterized protein DACRYDRAFT_22133 [Dacryopinax primogenitus]EJU01686.1 hypothetical protein DACRYDRAFT_22133 [Dacryopinax primogenitus]